MRGRIRTVKPELFLDERLWDLAQETGLPVLQAFIGLWCHADREGRFEWRPRALKTLILPYWEGDFDLVLQALERRRFIVRYEVGGDAYGYVRTFKDHQVVNQREAQSTLPPPPDDAPEEVPCTHVHAHGEGNGRELERKGAGSGARAPVEQPLPEVPGLRVVAAQSRVMTMPGPEPPKEYLDRAVMENVSREQAASTWKHYYGAGLPQFGVERLHEWLLEQARDFRTRRARLPDNPRSSGIRPVSDLDTTSAACAYRMTSEQAAFCGTHGLPLETALARCRGSPRFANLSTPEQEREMTIRLQFWRRTGAFPDPNEPLPRAKPKEARA